MNRIAILIFAAAVFSLGGVSSAYGQQLQSFQDCVVGKRVSTNGDGRKGVITRLDKAWSYCYVRFDDNGKETSFLYSLLNAEGGLPASELKLKTGVYECVAGGDAAGRMKIDGPNAYSVNGTPGKFHIETSGKIVFETGPYKEYFSKLVAGGRIALSRTDSVFYGLTCQYNATLH